MENFLRVNNAIENIPASPSNSFMADEVASICPLITPSPPTNDLINPEPSETNYGIGEDLVTMLQQVQGQDNIIREDSASSSSSAEPVCTQLLNHRNTYFHIQKDEVTAIEETTGKVQPLQLTFRNPPENYFFMSWNWPVIRKISLWLFLSALVGMLALVIAMISALPKTCNPYTYWYQGGVLYEVFPASFSDSNNDMIGDFKGLSLNTDYVLSLGVKGIRLNSIFTTQHYPEDYQDVTTLIEIAPALGDLKEFQIMVKHFHVRNISVILDLPIYPLVKHLTSRSKVIHLNGTSNLELNTNDVIEEALIFWTQNGVDGFYFKGLEHLATDPNLANSLRHWKKILGRNRPIIVNESLINNAPKATLNTILNNVDLVDIRLKIEKGVIQVSKQLESIKNSTFFARQGMPWILWNIGDETTTRLANILPYGNATLGATLLQLMLPGTPSIFYGNEVGLQQIRDPQQDRSDLKHLHHLAAMVLPNRPRQVHNWMHGDETFTNFAQVEMIAKMISLRDQSPSIYVNSVAKQGDNKANAEVKYSRSDLLVIQRWYPRRKSFVVVSNLGNNKISADLSTLLYSGIVVIGPRSDSKPGSVSFKEISLWPGESVVIQLD